MASQRCARAAPATERDPRKDEQFPDPLDRENNPLPDPPQDAATPVDVGHPGALSLKNLNYDQARQGPRVRQFEGQAARRGGADHACRNLARVGDRSIPPRRSPILYAVVDNPLTFHRLAITDEQIGAYGLPTKPRKQGDRRPRQILETVEAEAMLARILRSLLSDKVERFMPRRALAVAGAAEESEQAGLLALATAMDGAR